MDYRFIPDKNAQRASTCSRHSWTCLPGPRQLARLEQRLRTTGTTLLTPAVWPGTAQLRLTVEGAAWESVGDGYGSLRSRTVTARCVGRRRAARSCPVVGQAGPASDPGDFDGYQDHVLVDCEPIELCWPATSATPGRTEVEYTLFADWPAGTYSVLD
jgi:hypothetical protein